MNSLKVILFLNELEIIYFQLMLLKGFTDSNLALINIFNINYLFAHSRSG